MGARLKEVDVCTIFFQLVCASIRSCTTPYLFNEYVTSHPEKSFTFYIVQTTYWTSVSKKVNSCARGWSHRPLVAPSIIISDCNSVESGGQIFILYILPSNFMVGTGREVWCDQGMRGWSHQPLLAPSVTISGFNSVGSGGPTCNSEHNPQQFHGWNWTESLVWPGAWGADHTNHFLHPMSPSPAVPLWKVMDQHLILNIIANNFTARTGRKIWCDQGMRGWSHQPLLAPSVGISDYNSVESGGPTSNSQHNPQQSHG